MKPTKDKAPAALAGDSLVPLESVLCTEELNRRPARPPDYETENRALVALAQALADSPRTILQVMADLMLETFRAGSAGFSLLTKEDGGKRFFWPAIAGLWKPHIGGGTPRDFGPCGDVLDRNSPLLFKHFERRYAYLLPVIPPAEECLLVPFYVEGKAIGTIWVIAHDDRRKFDAEDMRQLISLSSFASSAYQAVAFQDSSDQRAEALEKSHTEIVQDVVELHKTGIASQASRLAALNLMEDAVESRQAVERLNVQLRESERQFREMIDALPAAVYTTDAEGRLTYFNPAAVEFSGHMPVLGTNEWCVTAKLYYADGTPLPHGASPMGLAIKEGRSIHGLEVIAERPDGTRVWGAPYPTPLKNSAGEILGGINMVVDITERKEAEEALRESEKRYRGLFDSIDEGFCVVEMIFDEHEKPVDYRFLQNSPSWEKQTGLKGATGKTALELMPNLETYWVEIFGKIALTGEPARFQNRAEPLHRWYDVYAFRVGEPNNRQVAILLNDITERKEAQDRLRQSGAELAVAVEAKTAELLQSHEQLRALATELNLTEQRERKQLAAELHDHLAQLLVLCKLKLGQSRRLTGAPEKRDALIAETDGVLSDALTYTRTLVAELSPPILYEFGLPAALKWLAEGMQQHALAVTVHSETEPPKLPDDQAVPLFQSIRELLMNAAKHAQSGKATVRLDYRSGELRIEVRDHGVGFQPNAVTAQGTDTAMSTKFGLFSIRERMRALGGRFELDSTPGEGTTAIITLPVVGEKDERSEALEVRGAEEEAIRDQQPIAAGNSHRASPHTPHRLPVIRVLLVDDHAMMRQGLRTLLEAHPDVTVVGEAVDGEEAVAAAEALHPSHIVMDINMPKMNGIEATQQITSRYPNIIVIGLSVNAGGVNADAMKQAGAAMLLTKEAAVEELYRAIRSSLAPSHLALP